ncbi:MAG: hypothetical protein U9R68_10055, partial [Planctomycetota bacterium]|nr:hypothetical protein [Planctomycetota bacterium]
VSGAAENRGSPRDDYQWQQRGLTAYCQHLIQENHETYARALRLAQQAERLSAGLAEATAWPADLKPVGLTAGRTFLASNARRLDEAIAEGNLEQARAWAREFHATAAALADLHRWTDLILRNEMSALAFQKQCRALYLASDRTYDMEKMAAGDGAACFPGAQTLVCAAYNLTEVEHQAEWMFAEAPESWRSPADGVRRPARHALPEVAAAVRMPPHLREAFADLRGYLSAPNQRLWDEAAADPYHHTYLANILHRYRAVGVLEEVGEVLKQFDRVQAEPTANILMDVLFYRGGSPMGTRTADDRFDPRLMKAARTLAGTPEQVLLGAQHFTRALFGSWENYGGTSDSLAGALDAGKLDCVDATNMIGALYRNAGRGGFYAVRWCAGVAGHSVSGALIQRDGQSVIGIVDGLGQPQTAAELWPHAYAGGHAWPKGYVGTRGPVYAVEVLTRGLDSYVWCQGFIVRGEHAGTLVRSTIPYLPAWTPSVYARRTGSRADADGDSSLGAQRAPGG